MWGVVAVSLSVYLCAPGSSSDADCSWECTQSTPTVQRWFSVHLLHVGVVAVGLSVYMVFYAIMCACYCAQGSSIDLLGSGVHWIHIIAHIFVQYIYWYCTHAHMVVQSMSIGNWFTLLWINWITLNFRHEWYSAQVSWSSIAILVCIRCVHVTQYRNLETVVSLPLAHYYYAVDWLIEWRMCTFLCMYAFLTYWTVCGFVEYLKLWAKCVSTQCW